MCIYIYSCTYHSDFQLQKNPPRTRGSRLQPDSVVLTCALAALEKASEWQAAGALLAAGILRELELEIFWRFSGDMGIEFGDMT